MQPPSFATGSIKIITPPLPLWLYKLLAVFPITGFLGLDHFALGSQFTGMGKFFINIITLGSWYAYDIVQVYNSKTLNKDGLNMPFLEAGGIGKGKIEEKSVGEMSKSTKTWLYVLLSTLFLGLYYITTFFVSEKTDFLSNIVRYFSKITFYTGLAIGAFTLIFYLTAASAMPITNVIPANTPTVVSSLSGYSGTSSTGLNMLGGSLGDSVGDAYNGNEMKELQQIAQEVITGGNKQESFQHIYFGLILLLLPLSGYIIYTLRKYKKKDTDEKPAESNTV